MVDRERLVEVGKEMLRGGVGNTSTSRVKKRGHQCCKRCKPPKWFRAECSAEVYIELGGRRDDVMSGDLISLPPKSQNRQIRTCVSKMVRLDSTNDFVIKRICHQTNMHYIKAPGRFD
jgi:hypothetical protein